MDEWPITSARMSLLGLKQGDSVGLQPEGGGGVGRPVCIEQHATLEARVAAAREFVNLFGVRDPVAASVDAMDNGFQTLYASWPIRWYVFRQREGGAAGVTVAHIGEPDESSFDLGEVQMLLDGWAGEGGGASAAPAATAT